MKILHIKPTQIELESLTHNYESFNKLMDNITISKMLSDSFINEVFWLATAALETRKGFELGKIKQNEAFKLYAKHQEDFSKLFVPFVIFDKDYVAILKYFFSEILS